MPLQIFSGGTHRAWAEQAGKKVRFDWRSQQSIAAGDEAHRWLRSVCGPAKPVPLLQGTPGRVFRGLQSRTLQMTNTNFVASPKAVIARTFRDVGSILRPVKAIRCKR